MNFGAKIHGAFGLNWVRMMLMMIINVNPMIWNGMHV